jgi:hypothetical protein
LEGEIDVYYQFTLEGMTHVTLTNYLQFVPMPLAQAKNGDKLF